ncbi:hypothetical protein LTR24_003315 [Lithohypha guttulata]|uniref:Uncharacterized protein n=1 Tax=Lithohypha guttulata TaxID=1690604 RepID=A0ABR0KF34_9EURO|nr:hypothetical protein LTR24_003315 [Lithohypha guttulata]
MLEVAEDLGISTVKVTNGYYKYYPNGPLPVQARTPDGKAEEYRTELVYTDEDEEDEEDDGVNGGTEADEDYKMGDAGAGRLEDLGTRVGGNDAEADDERGSSSLIRQAQQNEN